jgi:5-methylcytosine-specific restriction enzyme B
MNLYKLQIKEDGGDRIAEQVLLQGGVTSDIQYAGSGFNELKKGDIIAVHKGSYPIALVEVIRKEETVFLNPSFGTDYRVRIISWFDKLEKTVQKNIGLWGTFPHLGTFGKLNSSSPTYAMVYKWYLIMQSMEVKKELISLIKQKHQIILQGPPGTGKTRMAKEIASNLITLPKVDRALVDSLFKVGQIIDSAHNYSKYKIASWNDTQICLELDNGNVYKPSYREIQDALESQLWNGGQAGANDSYRAAVAKYVFHNFKSEFVKLVQFHPAYTYEDFVRGITAKPGKNALGILYEAENRVLAETAKKARLDLEKNGKDKCSIYVLIIDEMNRANLPAVLGELIYALEYRGEFVHSLYPIDGESAISLPENLYIIGTMNTADRSVGHIDYAIRRRFAFYSVTSSDQVIYDVVPEKEGLRSKALQLFDDVKQFFTSEFLSPEFNAKDVQLGHSYFLADSEEKLRLKLEYEIKPLLLEYLRDGVLRSRIVNSQDATEQMILDLSVKV